MGKRRRREWRNFENFFIKSILPIKITMSTPTNIQNEPEPMDIQQDPLANSLVLDFLLRNSLNEIASEFQKISHEVIEIQQDGLKLEHLVNDLFVKSIVYDFLRRTAHAKIAFEFKLLYGPFKDLNGLTLEKLYIIYKEQFNAISTNPVPSTSQKLRKTNKLTLNTPGIISVPSTSHAVIKSAKKVNSLVYNYLVRNYHFDVAIEFMKLVGSLEDVEGGPLLEDMFTYYMQSMKNNAKVITDKEQYLKIVMLNDEYHKHIQNFQPKVGSQSDQVVQYLVLQNLKTHILSLKLDWHYLARNQNNYHGISVRHFSICKGGEIEMI